MIITPGLASELDLLTQALDLSGTDMIETLTVLAADARTAVDSYLGLSVEIMVDRSPLNLTALDEGRRPDHIRTSLLVPLSPAGPPGSNASDSVASVALVLYAATPGAFIDLAADLSWITGRALAEFRLDEHCTVPSSSLDPGSLAAISTVNQALGVLIGLGSTPEEAEHALNTRAALDDTDLAGAAKLILAAVAPLRAPRQ